MNKRVILIALTAVMLSTVSYAQKVIKENGAVIIDCSEMGSKFYTSEPKKYTTTATDTDMGPDDSFVISSATSNQRVYKKFEVSKRDNGPKSTWKGAIELCNELILDSNDKWRLPTQRELMLMCILKKNLNEKLPSPLKSTVLNERGEEVSLGYWSATELREAEAWHVFFDNGYINYGYKADVLFVRCIRDI